LVEFAAKGFHGASTRSIAERVDAYQPQINYHFESKEALWTAAVDHLFDLLRAAVGDLSPRARLDGASD
jgi:AcrR family transcriptional regulator